MLYAEDRSYAKERCFRLPARARFAGQSHEAFPGYKVGTRTLERATFRELSKSPDAMRGKFERDVEVLTAHVRTHPSDPRWHYHLGDSLKNLGRPLEAVAAYDACAALRGWNEESAWACYQAAECLAGIERYAEAIDRCALGLVRHVGAPSWPVWLLSPHIGWERATKAAHWARLSITHGLFEGDGAKIRRIGFRNSARNARVG
jgi:tetratricopeptide (TPR) repeat protein